MGHWHLLSFRDVWGQRRVWRRNTVSMVRHSSTNHTLQTLNFSFGANVLIQKQLKFWRRGGSNPRPKRLTVRSLHAYPSSLLDFADGPKERATTNRQLASCPAKGSRSESQGA